jgi:hypothetical protein
MACNHFIVREADPNGRYGGMVLAVSPATDFGHNAYGWTTDGVNWNYAVPPSYFGVGTETTNGCWSDYHGAFYLAGFDGIVAARQITGGADDWKLISTDMANPAFGNNESIAAFGRLLIRSDGKASINGGRHWFPVLELPNGVPYNVHSVEGIGVGFSRITGGNDHRLSYLVGM